MHPNIRKMLHVVFTMLILVRLVDIGAEAIRFKKFHANLAIFDATQPRPHSAEAQRLRRFLVQGTRDTSRQIPRYCTEIICIAAVWIYAFFRKEVEAEDENPIP